MNRNIRARIAPPLAVLAATVGALSIAGPATAAESGVTGGDADWGYKASWRSYILNVPPSGSINTSDGATTNPDGTFDFPVDGGSYDPDTGVGEIQFSGTVTFAKPGHFINVVMSDPRIEFDGTTGTVYADLTDSNGTNYPDAPTADLDLSGVTPSDDGTNLAIADIPATATAEAQPAFNYDEGEPLDPVSFSVTYEEGAVPDPDPDPDPAGPIGEILDLEDGLMVKKGQRKVEIAQITCSAETHCDISTPKRAKGKVRPKLRRGAAPKVKPKIRSVKKAFDGNPVSVYAKFRGKDAKRLKGARTAKFKVPVTISSGGEQVKKTVKVKVRGD